MYYIKCNALLIIFIEKRNISNRYNNNNNNNYYYYYYYYNYYYYYGYRRKIGYCSNPWLAVVQTGVEFVLFRSKMKYHWLLFLFHARCFRHKTALQRVFETI